MNLQCRACRARHSSASQSGPGLRKATLPARFGHDIRIGKSAAQHRTRPAKPLLLACEFSNPGEELAIPFAYTERVPKDTIAETLHGLRRGRSGKGPQQDW